MLGVRLDLPQLAARHDARLGALYRGAIALIQPSYYEGFGLPVLEAITLGCPVIGTYLNVFTEQFGDAVVVADIGYTRNMMRAMVTMNDPGPRAEQVAKGHLSAAAFHEERTTAALHEALDAFEGGRLVVNVVDMPIKCPIAPLEFAFLADWFFTQKGNRDKVTLTYVTPLDNAFTKPVAAEALKGLLSEKHVELVTEFNTGEVDGTEGKLIGYDGREVPFDLAVMVPLHSGADFVGRSEGLGDDLNFVPTNQATLQSKAKPNVFAIGDATNLPSSKAGSVTHFEADVLTANIVRHLRGEALEGAFDGHANCFVETGFGKALLIDFNYETEPLPGTFPLAGVGPLRLLHESRLNHVGKLLFQWVYWHALLPGRDIPGISTQMQMRGKRVPAAAPERRG